LVHTIIYLRNFADSFNDKLTKELLGINTRIRYMCDEPGEEPDDKREQLRNLVDLGRRENLLYIIQLDKSSVEFNSVNVLVLNQWPMAQRESAIARK
jgi:hypothetical protein